MVGDKLKGGGARGGGESRGEEAWLYEFQLQSLVSELILELV